MHEPLQKMHTLVNSIGGAVNVLGSMMIWYTDAACELVPRSDRRAYRAKRPIYGKHRKRSFSGLPRQVAIIWSSRRCAPRLRAKPAMLMWGNKLLVHPAMKAELEHHLKRMLS